MEQAKDILDRLKKQYVNNPDAMELIDNSYDEVVLMPNDKGKKQALDCERVLSLYY